MKINFKKAFADVQKWTKKNSPAIMTGIGVVGLASTAVLTGIATYKATRKVDEAELHKKEPLTKKEVVKTVWKEYIPAAVTGTVSAACIIGANSKSSKRNAALATAYQATQVAFTNYKDEVLAQIGEKKANQIDYSIVDKKVKSTKVPSEQKIIVMDGDTQLFYDDFSGRYFKSTMNDVQAAVNATNQRLLSYNYASVNDFWEEIDVSGLKPTEMGGNYGWNVYDGLMDINFDTHMTDDGRSAIVITLSREPKLNFDMFS